MNSKPINVIIVLYQRIPTASKSHHQVRHIPCIRRSTSQVSLFEHLKQYHYLNYAASMQIVRLSFLR